jgi:hypothetical protein
MIAHFPGKYFPSGNNRVALDGLNFLAARKGKEFWHMECSNIIQNRSTAMSDLSVKRIHSRT